MRLSLPVIVAACLLSALALVVLVYVPKRQVARAAGNMEARDRIELENQCRATVAQILGGLLVLVGLLATWRTVQSTWESVELARQGQITERFARAVELLGSEKLEVRLGGIYALERIARDSERDHWPIMEVLTAYVRENSAWRDEKDIPSQSVPLATDIQAVLTVLNRRTRHWDDGRSLDLQCTDLRRAHLEGAHLEKANLFATHLEGAMLTGAHLEEADLSAARLQGARLSQAHLERAMLMSAHLNAAFEDAHLDGAWLQGAILQGADLAGASLKGADLTAADLSGAHLAGADLSGACLRTADLSGADLTLANLSGAHMSGPDLSEADLSTVDEQLAKAGRSWESMNDAKGLTREQIESAITDETTLLPEYLKEERGGESERTGGG